MSTKHTPAPWEACERGAYTDFDGHSRVVCGDDRRIAVVQHSDNEEDEANSNLIAAAPEMYSELLRIVRYGYDATHDNERVSKILAKAEGGK